ncbi:MAG: metallophosphoesterase family protein [Myxococcota bacterium]
MTRIAHLSDLHLLEETVLGRTGKARLRVGYLSLRRPIDFEDRRARAVAAIRAAQRAGFDHVVVTGDLTEDGHVAQFEVVREVFEECGLAPEQVTLTPGNHDAYGDGWDAALAGPLHKWAKTSARGSVASLPGAKVVSLSSAVPQSFLRSSGVIDDAQLHEAADHARKGECVILAQHHPPFKVMHQWVHGLLNHEDVTCLLGGYENLHVLHGHIHRRRDRALQKGERPRVFSPTAVADSPLPLRVYEVIDGAVTPVDLPAPATPRAGPDEAPQAFAGLATEEPAPKAESAA